MISHCMVCAWGKGPGKCRVWGESRTKEMDMSALRITLACFAAMCAYSVLLDMVSVRLSQEYFTSGQVSPVPTDSPTLMAVGWGLHGGASGGVFLGIALALVSTLGQKPPLTMRELWPGLLCYFAVMAYVALAAGLGGWCGGRARVGGVRLGGGWGGVVAAGPQARFVAVWCAHVGASVTGMVGAVVVCVWAAQLRAGRSGSVDRWLAGHWMRQQFGGVR